MARKRKIFIMLLIMTIICGILSRVFHTGSPMFDKYLGDALYAIMFYLFFGIAWINIAPMQNAIITMISMTGIELFQLTLIPLSMSRSSNFFIKVTSILLGTRFSVYDIISYIIGIIAIYCLDKFYLDTKK